MTDTAVPAVGSPTITSAPPTATASPEPTLTHTVILTPTETASPTPSATATATDTVIPTATPSQTALPTMTPTVASDLTIVGATPAPHLWLARPVDEEAWNKADRFYPYGATGEDLYAVHHGVEFINGTGTVIYAVAPGVIAVAGDDAVEGNYAYRADFYGQVIVLELDQTYQDQPVYALYGHLSEMYVEPGQRVDVGEPLGEIGMTGVALGPHLHFEVRVGENSYWATRNPELWLKPLPGNGLIVGRVVNGEGKLLPEALVAVSHNETPDAAYRQAWTYTTRDIKIDDVRRLDGVNPDDGWIENWVLGDVPAGDYLVAVRVNGEVYKQVVTVSDGQASYVVLVVD